MVRSRKPMSGILVAGRKSVDSETVMHVPIRPPLFSRMQKLGVF